MTGQPHPLASKPTLYIYHQTSLSNGDTIQIHGDLIAWTIYSGGTQVTYLRVWNWKTGQVVWDYDDPGFVTYYVLDEHTLFATSKNDLHIYVTDPVNGCTLQLPPLVQDRSLDMNWVDAKVIASTAPPPSATIPCGSPAFVPDPALWIIAMYYGFGARADTGGFIHEHLLFIIPVSSVLSVAARLRSGLHASATLPWDDWGSNGARCVRLATYPRNLSVHGSRVVLSFFQNDLRSPSVVDLLTFDVRPHVRPDGRHEGGDREENPTSRFILPLEGSRVLSSPAQVGSTFPYRVTHREVRIKGGIGERLRDGLLHDIVATEDGVVFVMFFKPDGAQAGPERRGVFLRI